MGLVLMSKKFVVNFSPNRCFNFFSSVRNVFCFRYVIYSKFNDCHLLVFIVYSGLVIDSKPFSLTASVVIPFWKSVCITTSRRNCMCRRRRRVQGKTSWKHFIHEWCDVTADDICRSASSIVPRSRTGLRHTAACNGGDKQRTMRNITRHT